METPVSRGRYRTPHNPTPRMSERKKNLFSTTTPKNPPINPPYTPTMDKEMNILDGMMPLDFESAIHVQSRLKSCLRPRVKKMSDNVTDFLKSNDRVPLSILGNTPTRTCNSTKRMDSPMSTGLKRSPTQTLSRKLKTPSPRSQKSTSADEDLGNLLKDALCLRTHKKTKQRNTSDETISDEEVMEVVSPVGYKRPQQQRLNQSPNSSPKAKQPKLVSPLSSGSTTPDKKSEDPNSNTESPSTNKNLVTSLEQFSIPVTSFYSSQNKSPKISPRFAKLGFSIPALPGQSSTTKKRKSTSRSNNPRLGKNVSHKVPRPKFKPTQQTIDTLLKSLNGDKFKKLLENRTYKKQADEVSKIMRRSELPLDKSRPINIENVRDGDEDLFSDCEDDVNQMEFFGGRENAIHTTYAASVASNNDEADVDEEEEDDASKPRKFFKSRSKQRRNEFTINNVRGTVNKGHVSILPNAAPRKKITKSKLDFANEQAAVKDIIDWLGDDSTPTDLPPPATNDIPTTLHEDEYIEFRKRIPYKTTDPTVVEQQQLLLDFLISYNICSERNFEIFIIDPDNHKDEAGKIIDSLITVQPTNGQDKDHNRDDEDMMSEMSDPIVLNLTDSQETNSFRQRLPYNTNDPVVAEQQKTLLEFLIKNQICNEENFKIFITEPEKHRDKASTILENYVVTRGTEVPNEPKAVLQNYINNCMSIDPFSVAAEVPSSNVADNTFETSHTTLESMMSDDDDSQWRPLSPTIPLQHTTAQPNNENTPNENQNSKYFSIFYSTRVKPLEKQSTRTKSPKSFFGGFGLNQYQIDAGQKEFGARQCPKCGLVYTVHEPEEEKLHAIYHRSLNILKFKGWIDEDIVMNMPEWGAGGRIIRLTHNLNTKRMDRIVDILNIIDKELGIVSDMIPTPFVAYLAVRRNEIVGFSLVQPIKTANRYVFQDGIDCCTEETFNAKCGVMRIWVSPLNRRQRIATKLVEAIRLFAFPGIKLSIHDIAFSSPTNDGIVFAQRLTQRKDFLMYESF